MHVIREELFTKKIWVLVLYYSKMRLYLIAVLMLHKVLSNLPPNPPSATIY